VSLKLAILSVLAKCPKRRATLDEVRREVEIIIATGDQSGLLKPYAALGAIDIFQSGLVSRDDAGFQITDKGLSLLRSLESASGASQEVSSAPASRSFRLIDDLIGTEERLKIFDLELRALDSGAGLDSEIQSETEETDGTPDATSKISSGDPAEKIDSQIPEEAEDANDSQLTPDKNQTIAIEFPEGASHDIPPFLRRSFGSKVQDSGRKSLRLASLLAFIATKKQVVLSAWRRHFSERIAYEKTERFAGGAGGAAFALLSLAVVVTCVGAAIALGQIKSLKSEIAMLQREVLPLRERLAKVEQTEKAKLDLDQQEGGQNKSGAEKKRAGGEAPTDQTALNLSREEIQLIRDYIKPAPSAGTTAPAINVGDPVGGAMIPLPSPLTEKVPKLLGARFTTRNGAIIIVKRDSRQADAVLPSQ
jgi:hypothetical protein